MRSSTRLRRSITHGAVLMALLCSAIVVAGEGDGNGVGVLPSAEELEASGAVIGQVTVVVGDVFDTSIDGEDGWLYRSANKLHIETRPKIIEDQLLFKPGEPYRHRLVLETERILRANNYLYDAVIVPVAYDGHTVDLEVRTRDVWTLNPGISFSRSGGENTFAAQLQEDNLLGTGQKIDLEWESDVDRESLALTYFNPHFLESFTRLTATYVDSDDGNETIFGLARPFYALDVRRAGGVFLADGERIESRYQLGKVTGEFEHRDEYYEVHGGWSRGLQGRAVRRWTAGVTYERDQFEPSPDEVLGGPLPEDRELLYPWLGIEWVEDNFQERTNQDQILRTEDVLVGLRAYARVGGRARRPARVRAARLRLGIRRLRPRRTDHERLPAERRRPPLRAVGVRLAFRFGTD